MSLTHKILLITPGILLFFWLIILVTAKVINRDYWYARGRGAERTNYDLRIIEVEVATWIYGMGVAVTALAQNEREKKKKAA